MIFTNKLVADTTKVKENLTRFAWHQLTVKHIHVKDFFF